MKLDLSNGLILDLETGETEIKPDRREKERRETDRRTDKETGNAYLRLFKTDRREKERRQGERRNPMKPIDRSIIDRNIAEYFLRKDGYYIH